jgi:hypothetical protein
MSTRWSAAYGDSQCFVLDLGAVYSVGKVVIHWEAAHAKEYHIMISDDVSGWTSIRHETNGQGGHDTTLVNANARKIMMYGIVRGQYGYSIWEFEALASDCSALPATSVSVKAEPDQPEAFALANITPNPFNPSTLVRYTLPLHSSGTYTIYNMRGQKIFRTALTSPGDRVWGNFVWRGVDINGRKAPSGLYFGRLETNKGMRLTHKLVLSK